MAKKKVPTLVINFVLDETGSMESVRDATISGFNEYVETLKKRPEDLLFTFTKFNSGKIQVVHSAVPLSEVEPLNRNTYQPDNMTPLYDAIAHTIRATESAAPIGANVLCVIQTDGQENASKEYTTLSHIRTLIERKQAEGWTFAYLGADQDAWAIGGAMGVPMASNLAYAGTPTATLDAFHRAASATTTYAAAGGQQNRAFFGLTCQKCGHSWVPRGKEPVQCPKCRTGRYR